MDSARAPEMNESSNPLLLDESTFLTELEVLREICEEDIVVNDKPNASEVCITLHPATAGNKDAQYVCLTLIILVTSEYPDVPASFQFRNPRGMSEDELERITQDLKKIAEEKRGCEMMYDLIQAAKDSLTENNSPSLPCTICQCQFEDSDVFTKTACYHYFHSYCLSKYLQFTENDEEEEPKCPVCRKALESSLLAELQDAPEPSYNDCTDIVITPETRQWQEEMRIKFERQKAKGGHIDIEAENNKHLISIRHVPTTSIEDMVSQQIRNASLASNDVKVPQDQSKSAAEHTERKHKDGAPVFVHNKHRDRHGGHSGSHRRSRGRDEGSGHHRSYPKHSGGRDERPGSSRGHERSDQRWTGDRDRQMERRGNGGQKEGERKEETDKRSVQSRPARDRKTVESKVDRINDERAGKQEKEDISNQPNGKCKEGKESGVELSTTETKGIEPKEVKEDDDDDDGIIGIKESEKDEEGEEKKLNDGRKDQGRPSTGRSQGRQSRGGRDMKGMKNKDHRDKFQHKHDTKRHDHGQNRRRPARSDHSDVSSYRAGSQERHEDVNSKSRNNEREGRRGGTRGGMGTGGSRGGMRRGGSRGGIGRGGSGGGMGRDSNQEGMRRDRMEDSSKEERTGESGIKAGSSSERAEKSTVRPPPGFDQQPVARVQACKPPPGFDFR